MSTTETQKPCIAARSCHPGWDAQTNGRPRAGIAVAVTPGSQRTAQARESACEWLAAEAQSRPARWTPEWREALVEGLAYFIAAQQLPGSWFPALGVPRFVHGQSQGICDLFGARVERQNDGNYYVHPLPTDPSRIAAMAPNALPASLYWGAVEWLAYARAATQGRVSFRNPVMTGPLDTANYLLGTTVLMEWVYTEPQALHRLLDRITVTLIGMMRELQRAVGGVLHGDALLCVRNAFCLCSECRSLVSTAVFEEFEAPYLARIGQALGPYGIHACGSWERTVPRALQDPQLRALNGQLRENDLATLCALADGAVVLSVGRSINVHAKYLWPDARSFYTHVLTTVPPRQPLEIGIPESDLDLWREIEDNH